MAAIGLDVGHSAVKVAAGEKQIMFPTAAAPAVHLPLAEAAASAKADSVTARGKRYFVGQTAIVHAHDGALLDGLRDDWIETDEHAALLVAGYQRGLSALDADSPTLVLGLPSRLHGAQHERLGDVAALALQIPREQIVVLPQALGAYMSTILDPQGNPATDRAVTSELVGVIDIGYYTADFGLIRGGVWSLAGAKSLFGAHRIAQDLADWIAREHGVSLPLRDAEQALRKRGWTLYGKQIDLRDRVEAIANEYAENIAEHAMNVFGSSLPSMEAIVLAGGAAPLVFDALKARWPHVVMPENSRFAVAEGFRRYGLMLSALRGG